MPGTPADQRLAVVGRRDHTRVFAGSGVRGGGLGCRGGSTFNGTGFFTGSTTTRRLGVPISIVL
jgi:hypothetical protein